MAIRRVTGAVSPSELIFADANALGATYDGTGTTIERGETFTLPAAGTTAVSNGALRLEALKGDCTITNNGNSTLTNASGVDGTIVMRSGASDFPAFVRNSSMGSMSIPAREDFTGSLIGAGTFDGTIGSNSVVPASVGSSLVLVKAYTGTNIVSAGVNFQDLFNSTYQDYIVKIQCVGMSNHNCNYSFSFINSSGTATYGSGYKYTCYGNDATGAERRLNSNGADQGVFFNGIAADSATPSKVAHAVVHFHHPHTSGKMISWHGQGSYPREGTVGLITHEFGGILETDISATGLQFFPTNASASATLSVQSYGLKQS